MQTKTNIEDHVLAIQTYFKEKVLNQDFEVTRVSEYHINIKFDGKYDFSIWIGQIAKNCGFWNGTFADNLSSLNPEFTDDEKEKLHTICLNIQESHQSDIVQKEIDELEKKKKDLEAKIESLNSKNK
jgi:hypothetical protein